MLRRPRCLTTASWLCAAGQISSNQGFQQSETACPAPADLCSDGFIGKDKRTSGTPWDSKGHEVTIHPSPLTYANRLGRNQKSRCQTNRTMRAPTIDSNKPPTWNFCSGLGFQISLAIKPPTIEPAIRPRRVILCDIISSFSGCNNIIQYSGKDRLCFF